MVVRKWNELPDFLKSPEVKPYWEILQKKQKQLILKRFFDITDI